MARSKKKPTAKKISKAIKYPLFDWTTGAKSVAHSATVKLVKNLFPPTVKHNGKHGCFTPTAVDFVKTTAIFSRTGRSNVTVPMFSKKVPSKKGGSAKAPVVLAIMDMQFASATLVACYESIHFASACTGVSRSSIVAALRAKDGRIFAGTLKTGQQCVWMPLKA